MVTVRLGRDEHVEVPDHGADTLWVPLDALVRGLGWHVTDLGQGRLGLCPDAERCIPAPDELVDARDGTVLVDLARLADPLGVALARQPGRAAAVAYPPEGTTAVDTRAVAPTLEDIRTGAPLDLADSGRRRCVFAWASW